MLRSKWSLLILIIFCAPQEGFAEDGVTVEASIGKGDIQTSNPDTSSAFYDGLGLEGKLGIPAFETKNYAFRLLLGLKYMDLENRANASLQRETGNHIGPGVGFELRAYRFVAGYSTYFMEARHFWVGSTINSYSKFKYQAQGWHVGLEFPIGKISRVGVSYSGVSANFEAAKLGLSQDVPYSENTIWLKLKIATNLSIVSLTQKLFGIK